VKNKLKVLDLFSGLGGFSLGLERTGHFKTVAFCDNNKYSKLVIDKHWKGIKIYDDIKEITKEKFTTDGIEAPDIITGGVPCQPFSVAGKQKGTSDDRYLWPEMFRIIKAFKSKFVIVENVRGIVNIENGMVFETVCSDLESEGYEVQAFNIPAAGVGAPHRRERIWFIAVSEDVANTVSNDERREISRSYEEERRIQEEHRQNNSASRKSSRTSEIRNGDNGYERTEDVADTNKSRSGEREVSRDVNNERGRPSETRGESLQSEDRQTRTDNIGSGSEDVADTNSGLRRGRRTVGQSREDEDRFLHSKEEEQAREHLRSETVGRSSIRGETDVADTNTRLSNGENEEIQSRGQTSISSSEGTGTANVTNTKSISSDGREHREHQEERSGQGEIGGASSSNVSNTIGERGCSGITERQDAEDVRQSSKSSNTGWWHVEPNVGRVAHGVSGRVHRLKGLGNSIVPQIVEEIGYAIIKAMK